ncbi:unnamed protein product [Hermetia illucens]|uniref:Alpha-carbonic anhydrase domain-containing protein n=2 Tax=Hermetia illucens TaxID=343691 RepID=A0A7R8Z278_HERIL|nr:unnamed protein product [Hermetia illucens]
MSYTSLAILLVLIAIRVEAADNSDYFGYSPAEQKLWPKYYPECGGTQQSPIAILTRKAINSRAAALNLDDYQKDLPLLRLSNNGHTVNLAIDEQAIRKGAKPPSISGGNLKGRYQFEGLHFHWGKSDDRGSEHTINNRETVLELHIVHRNVKYTREEAPRKEDGFVVLAVLYELKKGSGHNLDPIIENLDKVLEYGSSVLIKPSFNIRYFLGDVDTRRYYQYQGSLTTPPCSESVTWIIFDDTLQCSPRELNQLRRLQTIARDGSVKRLVKNNRALQPLNNRKVYYRTPK